MLAQGRYSRRLCIICPEAYTASPGWTMYGNGTKTMSDQKTVAPGTFNIDWSWTNMALPPLPTPFRRRGLEARWPGPQSDRNTPM